MEECVSKFNKGDHVVVHDSMGQKLFTGTVDNPDLTQFTMSVNADEPGVDWAVTVIKEDCTKPGDPSPRPKFEKSVSLKIRVKEKTYRRLKKKHGNIEQYISRMVEKL